MDIECKFVRLCEHCWSFQFVPEFQFILPASDSRLGRCRSSLFIEVSYPEKKQLSSLCSIRYGAKLCLCSIATRNNAGDSVAANPNELVDFIVS